MTITVSKPDYPHMPATIKGDREGLELLKLTIEKALQDGKASHSDFDEDGEEYSVDVIVGDLI
jgi:hypothetical protein